jgi:hypothetical protein
VAAEGFQVGFGIGEEASRLTFRGSIRSLSCPQHELAGVIVKDVQPDCMASYASREGREHGRNPLVDRRRRFALEGG